MTILFVPDMSCGHCKAAVETALKSLPEVDSISVNLATHQIEVSGRIQVNDLIQALDRAGYSATVAG